MELRTAIIGDARSIAAVHIASWRAIYKGHMPDDVLKGLDLEQRATGWQERLALTSIDCIVAEAPPVIGFCNVCASRDPDCEAATGEISALYLDPQHWRRGVGRRLVDAAVAQAQERGYRNLTLWVLRENQRARSFYEAVGFSRDGEGKTDTRIIGTPLHEVRYVKSL